MTNNETALLAGFAAMLINFGMYGNLEAAILGAGTLTYVMSRILSWVIDKWPEKK
jgi:hypothetical protein